MKQYSQNGKIPGERESGTVRRQFGEADQDSGLEAVLSDFRASVHAWSEATYSSRFEATGRSRALVLSSTPRRTLWRQSLSWALSVVLTAAVVSAGLFQYHERVVARQAAIQRELDRQRVINQQHAREADDLLARVDRDVSREAPTAMEPLASLMADDEAQ
jgi:hypothetical protein